MNTSLRIGIAGLGTVGCSVASILKKNALELNKKSGCSLQLVAVSAKNKTKKRAIDLSDVEWVSDPVSLAKSSNINLFVEVIGGEEGAAYESICTALKRGIPVVTANKALLAKHGVELAKIAEENSVPLHFEAAVAGGIPIIKLMRDSFSSNKILKLYGIINGTSNYILTRMYDANVSFSAALKEAQALGYAELNPIADIDGLDTAHKLALLTSFAFGTKPNVDKMFIEGIRNITLDDVRSADEMGYRIKLLGVALQTEFGFEQRVHPTMLAASSTIAKINGVTNAVAVQGNLFGEILISGEGAGGDVTASSIIADIIDLSYLQNRHPKRPIFSVPAQKLKTFQQAPMQKHDGGYFVRLHVEDRAGVLVMVLSKMADEKISLESVVQKAKSELGDNVKTITLITYETTERAIRQALNKMISDGLLIGKPQMIRIERPA